MRNNTRHASTGLRSRTRTPAGYFFLGVGLRYSKPALPIEQQLDLLIQRGLEVGERAEALHYLTHINYYRLRAYWLPFEGPSKEGEHRFVAGTSFEDVLRLYIFDRELRLLLMDLIERVEVSMRTHWAHAQAMRHGPHAHLDPALYRDPETHSKCLQGLNEEISRSRETFIEHYRKTYSEPSSPPIWAVCEVMSLGQLSKWVKALGRREDRQAIADPFGLDEKILCSFLHHLSNVRNLCAHHSRLWNRRFTFTMQLPRRPAPLAAQFNANAPRNLGNTLVMLGHLISIISPGSDWRGRFSTLVNDCPHAKRDAMGLPAGW